jgi:hypothetical protein
MAEEGRDLPPRPSVLSNRLRSARGEDMGPLGQDLTGGGALTDTPAARSPSGTVPPAGAQPDDGPTMRESGQSPVRSSWNAFESAPSPADGPEPAPSSPAPPEEAPLPRRVPGHRPGPAGGVRRAAMPVRLPRALPDPDGKSRGAFEPARKPTDVPEPDPVGRGAREQARRPADIPARPPLDRDAREQARRPADIPARPPLDRDAREQARRPADVPGRSPLNGRAAAPARGPGTTRDPAMPRRGTAEPARRPTVIPGPGGPDRGAFEPPPKAVAPGQRPPAPPVLRSVPGAAAASPSRDEGSTPPPVLRDVSKTPVKAEPKPPARVEAKAEPESAPKAGPKTPATAEPSWAAVLATTARLWVHRRVRGPDPAGRRRGRAPLLIALALVLAAAGGLALFLSGPGRPSPQSGAATSPGAAGVAAAAAVRWQAAGWVARQVDHDATVACDPVMCGALYSRGFPATSLLRILPGRSDPLGAGLIVATAALRNQFKNRLATVYAPQVIASFGTGQAGIEIRTIPPQGAAAFRSGLGAAERAAKSQAAQILTNRQISVSPQARAMLAAGRVDERLLATLALLSQPHPVHVVAFGDANPGAGAGIPLRSAGLAGADSASGLSAPAYQRWLLSFLRAQQLKYRAASIVVQHTADGGAVVWMEFAAPSP